MVHRSLRVGLCLLLGVGCAGEPGSETGDGGDETDTGEGDGDGDGDGDICDADDARLELRIVAVGDELPWSMSGSDGVGALRICLNDVLVVSLIESDLTNPGSHDVNFCLSAGTVEVRVWLDEPGTDDPSSCLSDDPFDTCMADDADCPGCQQVTLDLGETQTLEVELVRACG